MSRHPRWSGGDWPPRREVGGRLGRSLRLLGRVLAWEAPVALVLWSVRAAPLLPALAVGAFCLGALVLSSRRFGLWRRRGWAAACHEGLLLWIGAYCMADTLRLTAGAAPWFGGSPS